MRKKKGSVLITVLVIFLIFSIILTLLFSTIIMVQARTINRIKQLEAKLIAEAGAEECLFMLNTDQTVYKEYEREFGEGIYVIEVTVDEENNFVLKSIGYVLAGENVSASYLVTITGEIIKNKYIIKHYSGKIL